MLENFSVTLRGGEALAVVGPNAAGKSTLVRTLAGLLPVTAGVGSPAGSPARSDRSRTTGTPGRARHRGRRGTHHAARQRPRGTRTLSPCGPADAAARRGCRRHRERHRANGYRAPRGSGPGNSVCRRAAARDPGSGAGPGTSAAAPGRAFRPPRHRPRARAVQCTGRGAQPAEWACWSSSTTCNARPSGQNAVILLHEGQIRASGPPAEVLKSDECRDAFAVEIKGHAAPGVDHELYSFQTRPDTDA